MLKLDDAPSNLLGQLRTQLLGGVHQVRQCGYHLSVLPRLQTAVGVDPQNLRLQHGQHLKYTPHTLQAQPHEKHNANQNIQTQQKHKRCLSSLCIPCGHAPPSPPSMEYGVSGCRTLLARCRHRSVRPHGTRTTTSRRTVSSRW